MNSRYNFDMRRRSFSIFWVLSIVIFAQPIGSFAALVPGRLCSDGMTWSHTATREEAAAANNNGIIAGSTQLCPEDALLGINPAVGSAKIFLNSLPKACVAPCAAYPDEAHIRPLDSRFAVCAAKFIQAYSSISGVTITSAYRDASSGENSKAGGVPNSNHSKGVALDMTPKNGDYAKMVQFAKDNPSFGVCFPLPSEQWHMTLAGLDSKESQACASVGIKAMCAEANFANLPLIAGTPPTPQQLVQGATDQQQLINSWAQEQDCGAGYINVGAIGSPRCLPLQVSGLSQTNYPYSNLQAQPMHSGVPGISGIGGSGFTSGIASLLSGLIPATLNTSNPPGKNSNMNQTVYPPIIYPSSIPVQTDPNTNSKPKTATSAIELIHDIAYPTSTKATSTSVVTVVSIGSVIVSPGGTQYSISNPVQATVAPLPGTHVVLPQQAVQQTFITPDLNKAPIQTYSPQQTLGPGTNMLNNMKQILVAILDILRPLRNSIQSTPPTNSSLPPIR
jgi:hypothetical protein